MISGLVRNEIHCLTLVEDGRRWVDNNWGGGGDSVFITAWGHDHIKTKHSSVLL